MALFKKEHQPTLDDVLKFIASLSEEDKAKVLEAAKAAEQTDDAEPETDEATEEAENEDKDDKSEETTATDEASEDETEPPTEESEEAAEDNETQEAESEAAETDETQTAEQTAEIDKYAEITASLTARIEAQSAEIAELKETVKRIVDAAEQKPFGLPPAPPVTDENNGKWEGPATKNYFKK